MQAVAEGRRRLAGGQGAGCHRALVPPGRRGEGRVMDEAALQVDAQRGGEPGMAVVRAGPRWLAGGDGLDDRRRQDRPAQPVAGAVAADRVQRDRGVADGQPSAPTSGASRCGAAGNTDTGPASSATCVRIRRAYGRAAVAASPQDPQAGRQPWPAASPPPRCWSQEDPAVSHRLHPAGVPDAARDDRGRDDVAASEHVTFCHRVEGGGGEGVATGRVKRDTGLSRAGSSSAQTSVIRTRRSPASRVSRR